MTLLQRLDNLILEAAKHPSPADEHLEKAKIGLGIVILTEGQASKNGAGALLLGVIAALELLIRERNALYPALEAMEKENGKNGEAA